MTLPDGTDVESLESFRQRARKFIHDNIPVATNVGT